MRHSLVRLIVLLVLMLSGVTRVPAAQPIAFDVPAQSLDQALHDFGQQSGMAVLVDRELTRQRRSMPLHGRFVPREGLQRLLEGTGLDVHYSSEQAFTVRPMRLEPVEPGSTSAAKTGVGSYALAIQRSVEQALCRSPITRPGSYRAALQVWIDARGTLVQTRLLASTGDLLRDTAVIESLRALRLARRPPGALAQPVTLLLRPSAEGEEMDCTTKQGA
ncbi:TonB C-terminal domain-containing protein [Pseudomonas sp. NPDC089554]|uniref:TonB C-terminal domain-containing protein n=1 Tax=Pseudomonas sp. NPDC089554 TaxID=3390653 RepID=UPI003D003490